MKRRELFWMLLPCLGLALFAVFLRHRPGAILVLDRGPFEMVVQSVAREPVTAYEVSQGYDSKLKIVIGHKGGKPPVWWGGQSGGWGDNAGARLFFEQSGKLSPVKDAAAKNRPLLYWRPTWDTQKKHYVARILTHLSDVPARPGRVVVQADLSVQSGTLTRISGPFPFTHVVRNAGEKIKAPVVSREPGLIIEKVEIGPVSPLDLKSGLGNAGPNFKTRVKLTLLRAQKEDSGSAMGSSNLVDEKGKSWNIGSSSAGSDDEDYGASSSGVLRERRHFMHFDCDLAEIPVKSGRVWLKSYYSTNNAWPLEIKIPLRDAQGRILYSTSALKPAPFIVESTQLRAADAQEKKDIGANTVLEVKMKYVGALPPGRDATQLGWRADWSQHLIDEKGKEYWKFTGPNSVIASGKSWSGHMLEKPPARTVTILYYLPLQQMPARLGRLKFHADIGLPGTSRVPVDVVVREPKPMPTTQPTLSP